MTLVNLKPSDEYEFKPGQGKVLLLACGALGREIVDLIERNRWTAFDLQCLPAKWHNTPEQDRARTSRQDPGGQAPL